MNDLTLRDFLLWMITSSGVTAALAVGAELPYVQDLLDKLSFQGKRLLFLALSLALPLLATALMVHFGYAASDPDTWFRALAAGFASFAASQLAHAAMRKG